MTAETNELNMLRLACKAVDEKKAHDIKVIDGDKGLFIAMPSKKTGDGDYRDIAHPINSDTRGMLQRKILEAYNNASDEEV